MWTDAGEVQLLHHFHHDANDGLINGTDELWALMGGGDGATPMVIDTDKIHGRQPGYKSDWSKISKWNSTQAVRDAARQAIDGRKPGRRTTEPAPRKKLGRSGKALQSAAKGFAVAIPRIFVGLRR